MEFDELIKRLDDPSLMICGRGNDVLDAIVISLSNLPNFQLATLAGLDQSVRDILIAYLRRDLGMEEKLEHLLTRLRQSLLFEVAAGAVFDNFGLDCVSSLAAYCFGKEYIFGQTPEEMSAVDRLDLNSDPLHVATIACYRPLHALLHSNPALVTGENPTDAYAKMLQVQVLEPLEERRLAKEIPSFGIVKDETSIRVREMYEENPYPRWTNLRPIRSGRDASRILVAGCGSCRHAIEIAVGNPGSSVLGLDLSRASLAYGMRKAREYGASNLTLMHGDILDFDPVLPQFDYIECAGVLHHMKSPGEGLRALRSVLTDDGVIALSLYSSTARRDLVLAMKVRDKLDLSATAEGVRALRRLIYTAPNNSRLRTILSFSDFYKLSECRDLLFHVQEHRFNLEEINHLLVRIGFKIQSLKPSRAVIEKFRQQFPDWDEGSLSDWAKFEEKYPSAFLSMYSLEAREIFAHP